MHKVQIPRSAMVVMAHADDAEFSCSGTVAKWCASGCDVIYVLCTDGSKGSENPEMTQNQLSDTRTNEQIEAGKILGLKDIVFLNHEDSKLQPTLELRRDIAKEIRRHRPEIVVCTYPMRNLNGDWGIGHPDHMAAGEAALSAVYPTARDHMTFPNLIDENLEPHKVTEVWIVGHPDPDHWVDVTDHMDQSISALSMHTSQLGKWKQGELSKFMRKWREKQATGQDMQYAETFKRITIDRLDEEDD